jgi:hypothetical protein
MWYCSAYCHTPKMKHLRKQKYKYSEGYLQQKQKAKKSPSQKNPTEDNLVSNNDHVGYEVDNTYEAASEQCGDSDVYVMFGIKMNPIDSTG